MAPALDATSYIYQGLWIDWSRGRVLGTILTLSPSNAAILSPALAILISIAGAQLWRLVQFSMHQARATAGNRNFVYHQTQSILRNSATDLDALWGFSRLAFAWRHHQDAHLFTTIAPLLLCALLHLLTVTAAGAFSSWLLEAHDNVLSISPWCGDFDPQYLQSVYSATYESDIDTLTKSTEYDRYTNSRFMLAQQATSVCTASKDQCPESQHAPLHFDSKFVENSCPFNTSICHPSSGGIMSFDTGLLSSHSDLGYNAKEADRISVRMLTQCVPLKSEGYVSPWQTIWDAGLQISQQVSDAHYGASAYNQRNATATITRRDATCDEQAAQPPYMLTTFGAFPGPDGTIADATFQPIPELDAPQSDLSLVVSSFRNTYSQPVTDAWFSANQTVDSTNSSSLCKYTNVTMYTRQYPLATMSCTQQFQMCNSEKVSDLNSEQCTKSVSSLQLATLLLLDPPAISLTPRQKALARRILKSSQNTSIFYLVNALTQAVGPPLKVRNSLSQIILPSIPPTQWRDETEYWQQLMLAYFQQANLDYSTGQFAASTDYINVTKPASSYPYVNANTTAARDAADWLCKSQIIRSKEYRNFNFFALCVTLSLCVLIIILGVSIEDITGYIRTLSRRRPGNHTKQEMWNANSHLDMLRRIDELKWGTRWTSSRNDVPLTHVGHTVSVNDLMTKRYDVRDGGIVMTNIEKSRHLPHEGEGGTLQKCATCSQSGISTPSDGRGVSRSGPTEDRQGAFVFENHFSSSEPFLMRQKPGLLVQ